MHCHRNPIRGIIFLSGALIGACTPNAANVFDGPANTWDERARELPLTERYAAFRFGIARMKPPIILDDPMADGGQDAAKLIMKQNDVKPNDYVLVASVHVYDRMKARHIWSICGTLDYEHAKRQERLVKDPALRNRYVEYLREICTDNLSR